MTGDQFVVNRARRAALLRSLAAAKAMREQRRQAAFVQRRNAHRAKLTLPLVKAILELHEVQRHSLDAIRQWLEDVHGVVVTKQAVWDVCTRRTWSHSTMRPEGLTLPPPDRG